MVEKYTGFDMEMANDNKEWTLEYSRLKSYLADHSAIRISECSLSVPKELRAEFYALVERAKIGLTQDLLADQIVEIGTVVDRLLGVRESLMINAALAEFKLTSALETLIDDPLSAISKPAFSVVIEGLQKNYSEQEVRDAAARPLQEYCRSLARSAYEAWAYYGIVAALDPVQFYRVHSPDTVELSVFETDSITVGSQITSPERRIPEAVFKTASGRFFGMKSEVARELDYYGAKIKRRRDFSSGGNTVDYLAHRVLLLYSFNSLDDVSLIADRDSSYVLANDLMCEVLLADEIAKPAFFQWFIERTNVMKSKRPIQVVCMDDGGAFPEGALEDILNAEIEKRVIGLDENKLTEIAELLITN